MPPTQDADPRPDPGTRPRPVHPDPRSPSVTLGLPRTLAWADASTRRPQLPPSLASSAAAGPEDPPTSSSANGETHPKARLLAWSAPDARPRRPPGLRDQVRFTHERETKVSQPRRRIPASLEAGPHRLSTMSFLPRPWDSRAGNPPDRPDPRSIEVREQLRVSRRRSLAVLGFLASSRPRDREAPSSPGL
jgi:hypothetical protein